MPLQGGAQLPADENWEKSVEQIVLNHKNIVNINYLDSFTNLRRLSLIDNAIEKIEGLEGCALLEELTLEKNKIRYIQGLENLRYLRKLDLGQNKIRKLENLDSLEALVQLSLEDNEIRSLKGLGTLSGLMELYVGNNIIDDLKEIFNLKHLVKLIILDLSVNGMCRDQKYRLFAVFHLKKLKVLDGVSIEMSEHLEAKETYTGRLTEELLELKLKGSSSSKVRELDLSNCRLKDFDNMFSEELFPSLKSLNLSKNQLETLKAVGFCPHLRVLSVSSNQLKTLFTYTSEEGAPRGLLGLPSLQVLDISNNFLQDMYGL